MSLTYFYFLMAAKFFLITYGILIIFVLALI